jgi:hypothetical protein
VYNLTTLSEVHILWPRIIINEYWTENGALGNGYGIILGELSRHLSEGTEEKLKNLCLYSRSSGEDSNPATRKYEAAMLTTQSRPFPSGCQTTTLHGSLVLLFLQCSTCPDYLDHLNFTAVIACRLQSQKILITRFGYSFRSFLPLWSSDRSDWRRAITVPTYPRVLWRVINLLVTYFYVPSLICTQI